MKKQFLLIGKKYILENSDSESSWVLEVVPITKQWLKLNILTYIMWYIFISNGNITHFTEEANPLHIAFPFHRHGGICVTEHCTRSVDVFRFMCSTSDSISSPQL